MKKIITICFRYILIAVVCFAAFGCSPIQDGTVKDSEGNVSSPKEEISVFSVFLTEKPEEYEVLGDNPVSVEQGKDVVFVLQMKESFCIERISRKGEAVNAEITNGSDGTTTVSIHSVRYSMIVEAECAVAKAYISYYPNGGIYIDGGNDSLPYIVGHGLKNRLRPNTEIGTDRIERKGYVLNGWNTKADGSGEHVGLGSRVTVLLNQNLALYAEWEKTTPDTEFQYSLSDEGVVITRYTGKKKRVTIPSTIEEKPVVWIACRAFDRNVDVETVILPPSVYGIENGAFYRCNICELYFYDNVTVVSDECFIGCNNFSTLHINAIEPPRYGKDTLYSEVNLADKYDILILNADKKKVLVFGGSGAYISIDTNQMEKELGGEYVCINMAVNGWFNGVAQFEMMSSYLKAGDVFLHAPETSSQYSFMYDISMTPGGVKFDYNKLRFYACLESNYDLFSLIDVRLVDDFLDGFAEFNVERKSMKATKYTDYKTIFKLYGVEYENDLGYIDARGNFGIARPTGVAPTDAGEADIVPEYVRSEAAHERLNGYYDEMTARGVKVFFTTAPINKDTLILRLEDSEKFDSANEDGVLYYGRPEEIAPPSYSNLEEWIVDFEDAVQECLHCTVLLPLSETIYETSDYYEPDYHLSDEKVPVYTGMVTTSLQKALQNE